MKTIDRDLDLIVRHQAGPRLGDDLTSDVVLLTRPPSRILIAVDPEKKYADRASVRRQRDLLVRRLHEALPAGGSEGDPWESGSFAHPAVVAPLIPRPCPGPRHVERASAASDRTKTEDSSQPRMVAMSSHHCMMTPACVDVSGYQVARWSSDTRGITVSIA